MARLGWGLVLALGTAAACSASGSDDNVIGSAGSGNAGAGGSAGSGASGGFGGFGGSAGSINNSIVVIGPGADDSSPGKFGGGPDAANNPEFVYPEAGIITPPNMNSLEFHFKPGVAQTLFEIEFQAPGVSYVVYIGCDKLSDGCVYEPDADFWKTLADTSRGKTVTYRLRGVNGAMPTAVGESESREISFTEEDIIGGLYYWNDAGVVQRFEFGVSGNQAELFLNAPQAGAGVCVGCHAVSPNGKKIVVGKDIPAPAPYTVFDVATRQPVTTSQGNVTGAANFFTFSPDAAQMLYSDGVNIGWRDISTGNIVDPAAVMNGTMPDWSPDGSHLVFSRPSAPIGIPVPGVDGGSIELSEFASGAFGASTTLVPSGGQNNYYPAFAPDSNWIVFNRSASNQNSMSNTVDGELWAISRDGGSPVRMDAASDPGWTSWPKWAPHQHTLQSKKVMYFTFSTDRAYGLRLAKGAKTQLWMTAFDPQKAAAGMDPAAPAFRLPFQDIGTGNHIAQWVARIERKDCEDVNECEGGERCENGVCVPNIK